MPLLAFFFPIFQSLFEMIIGKTVDGFGSRAAAKADSTAADAKVRSVIESAEAERRIMQAMKLGHDITTPEAWNKMVT